MPFIPKPGARLATYKIEREIGRGGTSEIWLAIDTSLGREVALKFLQSSHLGNEQMLQRFLREARLAAGLSHPNTVTIHRIDQHEDIVYVDMEYVPGGSLADELEQYGPLGWRDAAEAVRDAARGLAAAHEIPIIHRDIKPSNLMRARYGHVKVGDFGIARLQQQTTQVTQTGALIGTPRYMSPEQCRGEEVSTASDIYSLTCSFYTLLTGERPFPAEDLPGLIHQHLNQPLPDPRHVVADIPNDICRLLVIGSQKIPSDRFASAAEFADELDKIFTSSSAITPGNAEDWQQIVAEVGGDDIQDEDFPDLPRGSDAETIKITISEMSGSGYPVLMETSDSTASSILVIGDELRDTLRRIESDRASAALLSEFGRELFKRLLPGDMATTYAILSDKGDTRIQLRLLPDELHAIPWELMFHQRDNLCLGINPRRPISRSVDAKGHGQSVTRIETPVRILVSVSDPLNMPDVAATREVAAITTALHGLEQSGDIEILTERHTSRVSLDRSLQRFKPHIFHFIGHGHLHGNVGGLSVENTDQNSQFLDSEALIDILRRPGTVRLAVLHACDSHSVAYRLAADGIASIGMLYPIRPSAAARLSKSLYRAVTGRVDLDVAVNYARDAVRRLSDTNRVDWCAPVLYLPGGVSKVFDFASREAGDSAESSSAPEREPVALKKERITTSVRYPYRWVACITLVAAASWFGLDRLYLNARGNDIDMVTLPSGTLKRGGWDNSLSMRLLRKHEDLDEQSDGEVYARLSVPPREVKVDAFYIDIHEVTNGEYDQFASSASTSGAGTPAWAHPDQPAGHTYGRMNAEQSHLNAPEQPATGVNWFDAYAYCGWAGKKLPTADEWEIAAGGPEHWPYPWGGEFDESRFLPDDVDINSTMPVTRLSSPRPGAPKGLAGNVVEWTATRTADKSVIRKGAAWSMQPTDIFALTFVQVESPPNRVATNLGFRCAADGKESEAITGMVRIAGGNFTLGGESTPLLDLARKFRNTNLNARFFLGEKPTLVDLDEFLISRYEVTNSEYRRFLEHVRKEGDAEFRHAEQPQNKDHTPEYWSDPDYNVDDLPVVGVDWFDAYAFAQFSGARLPGADEWEYAARGTTENLYPWGNKFDAERCISLESRTEKPLPVATDNGGSSPTGVFHLAGNVQEWTSEDFGTEGMKVVKGGGWNERCEVFGLVYVRQVAAAREYRGAELGIRVVTSGD